MLDNLRYKEDVYEMVYFNNGCWDIYMIDIGTLQNYWTDLHAVSCILIGIFPRKCIDLKNVVNNPGP